MKVYLDLGENDKCKEWINTTTEAFDEYFTNQSSDSSNRSVSIEDALTFFADMTSDFVEPNTCDSSLIKKILQSLVLSIVDLSEKNIDNLKQITGDTINVNSNGSKHEKQGNIKVIHITMNMNKVSLNFTKTNTTCNTTYLLISDIKTIKVVADGINASNVNASIHFKIKDEHKRMGAECFFWSETKSEWSKTGVKTVEMKNGLVKCISDHLTSFAIFVSRSEFPRTNIHSTALNIISLIGCGLSLFGVVLTLMVYALFSKTIALLRTLHYKAHINLLLSLGLMQTAFIVGINIANYKIGCKIAAVMLHYFSLTSFCWMGVEGVILYLKIIKVFNSEVVAMKLFYLFTWGIPMVFVGTIASFYFDDYGSNNVCWLTFQDYLVIWAFVAPFGLIVLMNMIVLCLVLRVSIKTNKSGKAKDRTKSVLKPLCILSPILGVTWLFGILAFTHQSVVWQYAFSICNSLQGFLIFVIYGLAKKELRDAIIRKFFIQPQIHPHFTHMSNKIDGFKNMSAIKRQSSQT